MAGYFLIQRFLLDNKENMDIILEANKEGNLLFKKLGRSLAFFMPVKCAPCLSMSPAVHAER